MRGTRFRNLSDGDPLDVLVVGGGMTGAPLYHELCRRGYRVALIDKGDFSSGTSQASGMLIWGGLLYLKNLDFQTVLKLCKARKELLSGFPDEVSTLDLHFLFSPDSRRSPATVWWILQLYWLMGGCALKRPFRMLLDHANLSLRRKIGAEDVISLRCGIRPLAVPRNDTRDIYPLDLSRRHRVVLHREKRAISLYGVKITSSLKVAEHVADLIGRWQRPRHGTRETCCPPAERSMHPELNHEFVTAEWARDHEFCLNLEDYLRRRTCIAQWTPRMGFGGNGCGREALLKLAETFAHDPAEARGMVNAYEQKVRNTYDPLLAV